MQGVELSLRYYKLEVYLVLCIQDCGYFRTKVPGEVRETKPDDWFLKSGAIPLSFLHRFTVCKGKALCLNEACGPYKHTLRRY